MKPKFLIQGGIAMAVLLALAFSVGQAYATTGCFLDTNGHWAETFICWMKDNGITAGTGGGNYSPENSVTRAEMAVFMQRLAEIPPSTGATYINAGLDAWTINGNYVANAYVRDYDSVIKLQSNLAGVYYFQLTPDLPASLYGRQMYLHSVKLCYDATAGQISTVRLDHWAGGETPYLYNQIADNTVRIDKACRTYTLPFDSSVWGSDHVVLYIAGNFAAPANYINVSATTFTLVPSATTGVLSPEDASETRPAMEASQPADGDAGTAP